MKKWMLPGFCLPPPTSQSGYNGKPRRQWPIAWNAPAQPALDLSMMTLNLNLLVCVMNPLLKSIKPRLRKSFLALVGCCLLLASSGCASYNDPPPQLWSGHGFLAPGNYGSWTVH
jgi:hypothetical protein